MMLVLVSCRGAHTAGLRWWAASDVIFACGFALIVSNDIFSDWVSGIAGNLTLDIGTGVTYGGMLRFLDRPRRDIWPIIVALGLGVIEVAWWIAYGADWRAMTMIGCSLRALLTAATAWQLLRHANPEMRPASTCAAYFYLAWTTLLLARVAWWLLVIPLALPADEDPTTPGALLVRTCLLFVIAPSYLWMISRRLDAELIRQARLDPLTGVPNRRVIWQAGVTEVARAARHGRMIAVLMMDIDYFKSVNDRWGHGAGDAVLIAVAKTLAAGIRTGDVLARVGGEEFLILLPDTDLESAREVAERIRHSVECLSVQLPQGGQLRCTISIGIAVLRHAGAQWESLVATADQALYRAKELGRNRVEILDSAAGGAF